MARERTRTRTRNLAEQVADSVRPVKQKSRNLGPLIPTGSTLLNLACTDNFRGGFCPGKVVTLPGGSQSGKTLLTLTMMAEVCQSKKFKTYQLIYDDVEAALEFDIAEIFGNTLAKRMTSPPNGASDTIQDLQANILTVAKTNKSFIYILDSFDALSSDEEVKKAYKEALAKAISSDEVKAIAGSYKTEKAKIAGQILRLIKKNLKKTGSTLIIVQQTRQKIGLSYGKRETTSGGNAPYFYSTHQAWLTKIESLKKRGRKIGSRVKAEVLKNKITGKIRTIEFDVYDDYGVDDIGSCIDFLVLEKYWEKEKLTIKAGEFNISATRDKLIREIEDQGLERQLSQLVGSVWAEIEASLKLNRKKRYV